MTILLLLKAIFHSPYVDISLSLGKKSYFLSRLLNPLAHMKPPSARRAHAPGPT